MASKFKREFKNVVYNYSDAEAKVREATSNDPWGPSSAVMSELADYTYHVQAYSLVMGMLWKRLNDHGRNWRHVYKSLIVLDYLVKGGSERVAQQCKDNMFSIQTLKDFQYVDKDGKDQGANIRDKAKQLVALIKDDKKLKEERRKAQQTRERQQALGSDSPNLRGRSPNAGKKVTFGSTEVQDSTTDGGKRVQPVEQARPGNESEEEMQLKLAIQLSKQQADEEDKLRRQEEASLTAALAISAAEHKEDSPQVEEQQSSDLLLDLDSSLKDPWGPQPSEPLPTYDSLVQPKSTDPWSVGGAPGTQSTGSGTNMDPWTAGGATTTAPPTQPLPLNDPWSTAPSSSDPPLPQINPFDLSDLGLPPANPTQPLPNVEAQFLGTNANLVNLDLLTSMPMNPQVSSMGPSPSNPFGLSSSPSSSVTTVPPKPVGNPFDANKAPAPTLMQLAGNNTTTFAGLDPLVPTGTAQVAGGNSMYPSLAPTSNNQAFNPFS